jgi:hypothetical protein
VRCLHRLPCRLSFIVGLCVFECHGLCPIVSLSSAPIAALHLKQEVASLPIHFTHISSSISYMLLIIAFIFVLQVGRGLHSRGRRAAGRARLGHSRTVAPGQCARAPRYVFAVLLVLACPACSTAIQSHIWQATHSCPIYLCGAFNSNVITICVCEHYTSSSRLPCRNLSEPTGRQNGASREIKTCSSQLQFANRTRLTLLKSLLGGLCSTVFQLCSFLEPRHQCATSSMCIFISAFLLETRHTL